MTDVASYISKEYAAEIIEKVRDIEPIKPIEVKALKYIKIAIAAIALGDRKVGFEQTMAAIAVMKANIEEFPTYQDSPEAQAPDINHSDTPIFSMF